MAQSKHWLITCFDTGVVNNPAGLQQSCRGLLKVWSFQIEKCPTTERLHLQAYFQFKTKKRRAAVKVLLGSNAFDAKLCENPKACYEYCKKDESRFLGPWSVPWQGGNQGERTDLQALADLVKDRGVGGVVADRPDLYIRYHAGIEKLDAHLHKDEEVVRKKEVMFFYGETNCGKTTDACNFEDAVLVERQGHFYDYLTAKTVVFDEADEYDWNGPSMKKLLGDRPYRIPVKGGFKTFNPDRVIFTSNGHPSQWLPIMDDALLRRVTEVRKYHALGKYTVETLY